MSNRLSVAIAERYRFLVLLASFLLMMMGAGTTYLLVVTLKSIAQDFGWPRTIPSLAYSAQLIGSGMGGMLMGYWLDRAGMGWPALVGAICFGLGAIWVSFIDDYWQLYLAYGFAIGLLGQGSLLAPLTANIMRWFDHRRGLAAGVVVSGQSLAGVLWPPTFRHFSESVGWRSTYFWFGVFALCLMVPVSLVMQRRPPAPAPAPAKPAPAAASSGPAVADAQRRPMSPNLFQVVLSAAAFCCCVAMAVPAVHLIAHATDLGHSTVRAAELLSVALAMSLFTRLALLDFLTRKIGGLATLFVCSAAQSVALVGLAFVDSLTALYLVALFFGLGYGGIIPCYPVIVREHLPAREIGMRTGAVLLFATTGMAVGGAFGGLIFDVTRHYATAFLIGAAFNAANLAIVAILIRRMSGPWPLSAFGKGHA
ncbi:MAG: MFS transporter [Rhodospirillales bacterium]|nr:MFS transporter [Rhodospirillales bacterium]